MKTLGEALPEEIKRIREEVIPAYESIGSSGQYAVIVMKAELVAAEKAIADSDAVGQLHAYRRLKGWDV